MFRIVIDNIPDKFGLIGNFGLVRAIEDGMCELITAYQEEGECGRYQAYNDFMKRQFGIEITLEKIEEIDV